MELGEVNLKPNGMRSRIKFGMTIIVETNKKFIHTNKMKTANKIIGYACLAAMLAGAAACERSKKLEESAEKAVAEATAKVQVKIATAERQNVEQLVEFTGTVMANVRNSISSAGATRIDKIKVEVGDNVKKGQTLVDMEPSNYLQAAAQLENLKVEYDRAKALYQSGGISKQQLDQLKTQLEVSTTVTQNLKENTRLVSPVSGVITARNFDNGDVVGSAPILVVEQLNPLKVRINVSEEYFARVKTGMKVDITFEVYPDKIFRGNVSLVYPTIDAMTRTFTVEISIPNEQMLIRPGMFARVNLNLGTMPRTIIPDIAVQKQQGTNDRFTFVIKDGVAQRRPLVLGRRLNDKVEVLSGVSSNEQVVVAGATRLVDKTEVEVVK